MAIPRASTPGAARREFAHRRTFREKIKWRTGCEGRINHIKRSYGWNRTELVGIDGAANLEGRVGQIRRDTRVAFVDPGKVGDRRGDESQTNGGTEDDQPRDDVAEVGFVDREPRSSTWPTRATPWPAK